MKQKFKKAVAFVLIVSMIIGLSPITQNVAVEAATKSVKLASLGSLGSLSVGKKTKSGKWWKMYVGKEKTEAFCMNLGYTCHSGDVYEDKSATYVSSSSGKNGLKACIGFWYDQKMKKSNKAYIMAQALFWSVEEGDISEAKLKSVISKIKGNTGYFSGKTVNELYKEIFKLSEVVTVSVKEYKYKGSGSHRQELLVVDSDVKVPYESVIQNIYYRQRIRIKKVNEDGTPMTGAKFEIEADNIDELYSYSANGDASATDKDMDDFTVVQETDANGWINLRLTYHITSKEYWYVPDKELSKLDSNGKKAVKAEMEDKGYEYASDLSKDSAEVKVAQSIMSQYDKVANKYRIAELDSGNKNITISPEYKDKGKTITLNEDYIWTNVIQVGGATHDWGAVEEKPYDLQITDKIKKKALHVVKSDDTSKDGKAHGEADLDGAVFGIYDDAGCTVKSTFYTADGKTNQNNEFTIQNGSFDTPYLRCGQTYYLKEVKAPKGYVLKKDVIPVTLDGADQTAEYAPDKQTVSVKETAIKGYVKLRKFWTSGGSGKLNYEEGAVFQVYLKAAGSYDKANPDYERDTLTLNEVGEAVTKQLYYGTYTVHQVDSGDKDTLKVDDFTVFIGEEGESDNGKTKLVNLINEEFSAYLRIIKKDGNTKKDVLKAGTAYQIYHIDKDGREELVTQTYSNGNKKVTADTFYTDTTGRIMTYKALKSGRYRIYETDAATGLHIRTPYIEVEINSNSDNYKVETDADGVTYCTIELEYTNEETTGKLSIMKKGEQLTDYKDGKFVYGEKQMDGVIFDIYAREDIVTQDNQGTKWFNKGELVGTITTGKGASFTSECGGLTSYEMDENGMVTVRLPLGKYHVKEKKTLYGYVLPDKGWDVEFTWDNKDEEYVLNATDVTDENGVLRVENDRAKAQVSLFKADKATKRAVAGAEFGIYTKHDIFNMDGEKIVDAGTRLGTVTTGADGRAVSNLDFPLMSEEYDLEDAGTPSIEILEEAEKPENTEAPDTNAASGSAVTLNSGDYYLKELSVPGSYYLNETEYPVHLEYKDQETKVIAADVEAVNTQTSTVISKTSITNSGELPGCDLQITDAAGNIIVSWTSGNKDSIKWNEKLEEMGYCNATAVPDEKGAVQVNGLLHDATYTLTETRPADGFVTADSISFQLVPGEDGQTLVTIVNGENRTPQTDNVVRMVDDTTKVEISKTEIAGSEEIPGCELEITEKDTDTVIESWTSTKEKHIMEQKLAVGKTYILTEKRPADGYVTADSIEFTIEDSGEVQSVQMKDDTTKIRLIKLAGDTGQGLAGASYEVKDKEGKKVLSFKTTKKGVDIEGKLAAGETYTFTETSAPSGYKIAKDIKVTVRDTGKVQKVTVTDEAIADTPSIPQTGGMTPSAILSLLVLACAGAFLILSIKRRKVIKPHEKEK